MKKGFGILFTLSLIIVFSGCKKSNPDIEYDRKYIKEIREFRKEAMNYMMTANIPGGSFAVFKDGKLIYSEGLGYASQELEVAATRNTKFRIGKVTECLTGVLYQMLVAEGKLHPDSTVQFYLPDFPEKQFRLPVGKLSYHTSGIRQPYAAEDESRGMNMTLKQGIEQFKNDSLLHFPGLMQEQSMFNYNLLGAVIEKVTGKTYAQLLKEYITDTLHLNNTVIDNPFAVIKNRSDFFDLNFVVQIINAPTRDLRHRAAAEGLLSNAEDLATFGNSILQSIIISEDIKAELLKPVVLFDEKKSTLNNGWIYMTDNNGAIFYGRAAGITGGGAALLVYPDEQLVVAATINLTDNGGQLPIMALAEKFRKKPEAANETSEKKE
jgi:CubicO group peptidase (beta-lactamase class C family)